MPNRMKFGCAFTNSLVSGMKSSRLSSNTYTQVQWRLLQHTIMHRVVIVFLHMYVPSYTDTLAHIYLSKPPYPCIVYPPSLRFCLLKVCKSPLMHALYMRNLTHTQFRKNQHTVHLVSLHAHVQVQWHTPPKAPNAQLWEGAFLVLTMALLFICSPSPCTEASKVGGALTVLYGTFTGTYLEHYNELNNTDSVESL